MLAIHSVVASIVLLSGTTFFASAPEAVAQGGCYPALASEVVVERLRQGDSLRQGLKEATANGDYDGSVSCLRRIRLHIERFADVM